VALALLLVACGGGRTHPSPAPATTGTAAPATTTTTVDPGQLPQTTQKPSGADPQFLARMQLLWQAVVTGQPAVAEPAFFPLAAYLQVKAIADPTHDWMTRLLATYDRDILTLHARIPPGAQLTGVDVPDARATWVLPGAEYNKGSYWRVYGTEVRYTAGGHAATFPIASLISWRGEWYVVHFITPPS
jgi:hypothetical protein